MKCSWCVLVAAILTGISSLPFSKSHGAETELNGHTFTLPDGFTIELVANSPLVDRPITAAFDEQGRLYVADSSGSNDKVQIQLEERPHRIVRLEDTNGDGRYDRSTVFADRMMFPEGTMWLDGSLYVAAPPSIWKLTDTDDDGVADERTEWFQGKTLTGCANDLHGPYYGPDGWIYWCKGAFAEQTYDRPGKTPFVTKASHIFRSRPDGTGIEPVMTGGMDNPVDVTFTAEGERIFTTTFLQQPAGGLRDGLLHAVYGGVHGKVWNVIENHPRTNPDVLPVLSHLGAAAPAGLERYVSDVFGADYQNNLFAACFNMQKVTRHQLTRDGGGFRSEDSDFLTSTNRDFHPTDVLEDADGSLLVVDTGGWYKLCCPTSQLGKPDVLGAIYRIRRTGAPQVNDPRGLQIAWKDQQPGALVKLLEDPRPVVQQKSIAALAKAGVAAVDSLSTTIKRGPTTTARRNAVWAATRSDLPEARAAVRQALSDKDESVRLAALHSVSLWRDAEAKSQLVHLLHEAPPAAKRAAAEALGRLEDKTVVPDLLTQLSQPAERFLEHSLIYALIEINDPKGTAAGLQAENPNVRRAAMIALDQMPGGSVEPEWVASQLASTDPATKQAAAWIVGRHAEWGDALAATLGQRLGSAKLSAEERSELEQQLTQLVSAAAVQTMLAERLGDTQAAAEERLSALRVMAQAPLKEVPAPWIVALAKVLGQGDAAMVDRAVSAAVALPLTAASGAPLRDGLRTLAVDEGKSATTRLEALAAVPGGSLDKPLFDFAIEQIRPDVPVAVRTLACDALAQSKLTKEQLRTVAQNLPQAGPLEVERLLGALAQSTDEGLGLLIVSSLQQSPALAALPRDVLKARLAKYGKRVVAAGDELLASLASSRQEELQRLEQVLPSLVGGDIRRGQLVFNSTKAACSSCHSIGYLGGKVGPDLTKIAQIRQQRDLLEAVLYPSASFVRSYEPWVVLTVDGQVFSGLLKKDAEDEVILTKGPKEEFRIAREDIEEIKPSTVSIMPAGLDKQLTSQELADLIAFLQACK